MNSCVVTALLLLGLALGWLLWHLYARPTCYGGFQRFAWPRRSLGQEELVPRPEGYAYAVDDWDDLPPSYEAESYRFRHPDDTGVVPVHNWSDLRLKEGIQQIMEDAIESIYKTNLPPWWPRARDQLSLDEMFDIYSATLGDDDLKLLLARVTNMTRTGSAAPSAPALPHTRDPVRVAARRALAQLVDEAVTVTFRTKSRPVTWWTDLGARDERELWYLARNIEVLPILEVFGRAQSPEAWTRRRPPRPS